MPRRASIATTRCAIGIDVGGTTIKGALVLPQSGRLLRASTAPTQAIRGAAHALEQLCKVVKDLVDQPAPRTTRLRVLGVAVPELVTRDGRIASSASLAWTSARLKRRLRDYGRAYVYSDVHAAAFAEGQFGAGRGEAVFLYISVGTGVSCSLVIDGQPFPGSRGFAIAFASGRTTSAAMADSLESRVSGPALLARARAQGVLAEEGQELGRLALRRGPAQRLVDAAADELAMHVAILANALDPGALVMGGGLGSAPGRYFETFAKALPQYRYAARGSPLRVCQAELGPLAGAVGAACCAVHDEMTPSETEPKIS